MKNNITYRYFLFTTLLLLSISLINKINVQNNSLRSFSAYAKESEFGGFCYEEITKDCINSNGNVWIGYVWKENIITE